MWYCYIQGLDVINVCVYPKVYGMSVRVNETYSYMLFSITLTYMLYYYNRRCTCTCLIVDVHVLVQV